MNDNHTQADKEFAAIPAATLVLFRHKADGPPDLLVVERSVKMAFAGGAIVFPGGRIDQDDHFLASRYDLDIEEGAARVAAIRETLEESGIAVGFRDLPRSDWIAQARERLHKREPFSSIVDQIQASLDLDALVPFARWCPGFRETRVFDTRFYIALAPDDAPDPIVDATENVSSFWASASTVLEAADQGKVRIIYPTRRNLERLALFESFAHANEQANMIPVEIIRPVVEEREGQRWLVIPEELGYPVTAEQMDSVQRGFSPAR